MNLDSRVGRIALEAKIAFHAFRVTYQYEPNEREKVAILNSRGFVNALRIVRHWEFLEGRLNKLADGIRRGEGV